MSNSFISRSIKDFVLHGRSISFYFLLEEIERNILALMRMSDDRVKFIFPVKSFPQAEVLQLAARHMNGFDVSNATELNLVTPYMKVDDIFWSSSPQVWQPPIKNVVMDGVDSLRVNVPVGDYQSRFGAPFDQVRTVELESAGVTALHFHYGEIPAKFVTLSHCFMQLAKLVDRCPSIRQVNLGGGFTGLTLSEVESLVSLARALFHDQVVVFEPGRWLCENAGVLIGSVTDCHSRVVTTLSRDAHLRWHREPFTITVHSMKLAAVKKFTHVEFVGATCNEGDRIGKISGHGIEIAVGDLVVVNNVSGYSLAWNHSFNGFPAADAVFI